MMVKVVSDGTFDGTHVYTEQGQELSGISAVFFSVSDSAPIGHAVIQMKGARLDVVAEAQIEAHHGASEDMR